MTATAILSALVAVLAIGLAVAGAHLARHYRERRQRGLFGPWPILRVQPAAVHPAFVAGPLGPAPESEVRFLSGYETPGGVSDRETWILCVLAREARRIFEFGTGTGKTAYLLALNAPPDAEIYTLALPRDEIPEGVGGDAPEAIAAAADESRNHAFYYEGTEVEPRIHQLLADSKAFDETPHADSFDLVFVDGAHARSFVESDSVKALRMVRPGGYVLWHDYRGPKRARGVFEALNALASDIELVHIAATSLVLHRRPESNGP